MLTVQMVMNRHCLVCVNNICLGTVSHSTGSSKAVSVDLKGGMHLLSLGGLECRLRFRLCIDQGVAVYVKM